ncbi:MAG: AAA family ATPase, partial [Bdellovibrionota bacterium]
MLPSPCKCGNSSATHPTKLIVLTGGPGAGKTAIVEMARRRFCEHVVIVPEAASIIFSGGFWRNQTEVFRNAAQRAIYHVQHELERAIMEEGKAVLGLCDRGTIDSEAYWTGDVERFWREVGSDKKTELARYHSVIHLRTPT